MLELVFKIEFREIRNRTIEQKNKYRKKNIAWIFFTKQSHA